VKSHAEEWHRSPQLKRAGTRGHLPFVIQFDLKRPNLALLHVYMKEGFQGVASPRPCLEFSLPRLGLELSASALPRLCLDLSALISASASTKLPWAHPYSREGACSQCSTLTQVCAAFSVYWVLCRLQDSGSLKTQRLRRRRVLHCASSGKLSDLLYWTPFQFVLPAYQYCILSALVASQWVAPILTYHYACMASWEFR